MEYAGAVEVRPPLRADEREWLEGADWRASPDGRCLRPVAGTELDRALQGLRHLVEQGNDERTYEGAVAAFDPDTFELLLISVRGGRVTRRTLRRARVARRDNVIDLAAHRRTISRQIG